VYPPGTGELQAVRLLSAGFEYLEWSYVLGLQAFFRPFVLRPSLLRLLLRHPTTRLATQLTKQLIADQAAEKPISLIGLFLAAALASALTAAPAAALAVTLTTTFTATCQIATR
jgi:hypothetical protein